MAFKKGHVPWNKGLTEENSHSYGNKYSLGKNIGVDNGMYGKKHSEKSKKK